jgi:hypothetical protein
MSRFQLNFAITTMACALAAYSLALVMSAASDGPYVKYDRSDAMTQVAIAMAALST